MVFHNRRLRRAGQRWRRNRHPRIYSRRLLRGYEFRRMNHLDQLRRLERCYIKMRRITRSKALVRNVFCMPVTFTCFVPLLQQRLLSSMVIPLARFCTWTSIFIIAYFIMLMCALYFRLEKSEERTIRCINRLHRTLYRRRRVNLRFSTRSSRAALRSERSASNQISNRSKVESFLNIIANEFVEDVGTLSSLRSTDGGKMRQKATPVAKSNPLMQETGSSLELRRDDGGSICHLNFEDFIGLLKEVRYQRGEDSLTSSRQETLRRYEELLLEKVNSAGAFPQITNAKEFYEFLQQNWDTWFPM